MGIWNEENNYKEIVLIFWKFLPYHLVLENGLFEWLRPLSGGAARLISYTATDSWEEEIDPKRV